MMVLENWLRFSPSSLITSTDTSLTLEVMASAWPGMSKNS